MRRLIWYIRSVFCKHEWEYEECSARVEYTDRYRPMKKEGVKVSATCKKCGWHRSYWKFE